MKSYSPPRIEAIGTVAELTQTKCLSWDQDDTWLGAIGAKLGLHIPGGCSSAGS